MSETAKKTEEAARDTSDAATSGNASRRPPEDRIATREHTLVLPDGELRYTSTAGTVVLREEDEKEGHAPKAEIFFVAYTRKDVDPTTRPLAFSFNGGPGSSSVWLHLGVLGPRRVPTTDDGSQPPPPYALLDNPRTLLAHADLVFVDPVSTGFSRMVPGKEVDPREFHGFKRDIECVGEFIRHYCARNLRWSSPKLLIGESYGTTRAAGLADYLQQQHGLFLNGIAMISCVLSFQTLEFTPGNDLPYALFLPSYAVTAWYHGKLEPALQAMPLTDLCDEVRRFAELEYTPALMQGARLAGERRAEIVAALARYTGLAAGYIEASDLRVPLRRFAKELLRASEHTIGRFDGRIVGRDRDLVGDQIERDPSHDLVHGVYSSCLNDYVRRELGFESDLPYQILARLYASWKFDDAQNRYLNASERLRTAMVQNPHLKVLVANGYYDLATPFFAAEYTFDHLGLPPALRPNVRLTYYEAGHMMYVHPASLDALARDLARFVATVSRAPGGQSGASR